jgi:hypothetical protein
MVIANDRQQGLGLETGIDIDGDGGGGTEGIHPFFRDGIGDENSIL